MRLAVQRFTFWSSPHVLHEIQKALAPSVADTNASTSVIVVLEVILVRASLYHLTKASACWNQTDTCLGAGPYLLRLSDEATMMTFPADNHPFRRRRHSALVIRVGLAQHKQRSDCFHLEFSDASLDNGRSQTSTALGVSRSEVRPSHEAFIAALAAAS